MGDVAWIGNDYWQWHKRGMEEVNFCLGVVAHCLVTGLLVTRPGFDSRRTAHHRGGDRSMSVHTSRAHGGVW